MTRRHELARLALHDGPNSPKLRLEKWRDADRYAAARSIRSIDPAAAAALAAKISSLRLARRWTRRYPELRAKTAAAVMLSSPSLNSSFTSVSSGAPSSAPLGHVAATHAMRVALCEAGCEVLHLLPFVDSSLLSVWVRLRRRGDEAADLVAARTGAMHGTHPWHVAAAWRFARTTADQSFVARHASFSALWLALVSRTFAEAWAREAVANRALVTIGMAARFPGAGRLALRRAARVDGLVRALTWSPYGRALLARRLDVAEPVAVSIADQFPGSLAELEEIFVTQP